MFQHYYKKVSRSITSPWVLKTSEARIYGWCLPLLWQVFLWKFGHYDKIKIQEQHHQTLWHHIDTRMSIWRREVQGFDQNSCQLHPTRVLYRRLTQKIIWEAKVSYLALPIKSTKNKNQSDSEFDIKVFEWKNNTNTTFGRRWKIEEG